MKKNKNVIIISIICLFLVILIFTAVYSIFNPSKKSIYGSRLADEVIVKESEIDKIKSEINNTGIVNNISYNKNVRIIKFIIDVKDNTTLDDSYKLGEIILNNFEKEVLSYYDIEVYITSKSPNYPIIGYHSTKSKSFIWTLNRGEVSE